MIEGDVGPVFPQRNPTFQFPTESGPMRTGILLPLAATCVVGGLLAAAGPRAGDDGEQEVEIAVADLPAVIREALGGVDVAEAERAVVDGATVYEVEFVVGGDEVELTFDEWGVLLGVEIEAADGADDDRGA